ncbi:MAG: hypothetical protein RLZZ387_2196 [Chloroflexota bacterium]|jgi:hypothetical protein
MTKDQRPVSEYQHPDLLNGVDPPPSVSGHRSLVALVWLRRVGLSLAVGLAVGALAFLAARGVGAAALFVQQQELLREVAGTLGGGIEGLASGDLRAARRQLQQMDAEYWRWSLLAGGAAAALAAALTFLRLDR